VDSLPNLNTVIESFSPSIVYTASTPRTFQYHTMDVNTLVTASRIARTVKSAKEADALRRATAISGECLVEVMKWAQWEPGLNELTIAAYFKLQGAFRDCPQLSFITIAGAGQNACFLHREECTAPVHEGELVVFDCGLFYDHYPGDITRTFPISGKYSPEQALVYTALLKLQKRLIQGVKPGVHWDALWLEMDLGLFAILQELGVLPAELKFERKLQTFFLPHGLSHHIGCNVHDHCQFIVEGSKIKDTRHRAMTMAPGHVISIEPGIYFNLKRLAQLDTTEPPYDQINTARVIELGNTVGGVRIEDDVLVTEDGCEVLSRGCPKEIAEIEALMRRAG
jgi:Xaa-Pro aminopeptidase